MEIPKTSGRCNECQGPNFGTYLERYSDINLSVTELGNSSLYIYTYEIQSNQFIFMQVIWLSDVMLMPEKTRVFLCVCVYARGR